MPSLRSISFIIETWMLLILMIMILMIILILNMMMITDNDHKHDSYTAAGAAPGASVTFI